LQSRRGQSQQLFQQKSNSAHRNSDFTWKNSERNTYVHMEAHVGLDIEKSRGGNVTIVGLTSGMAADVSGLVWEGDVLETGD
jgi:hypothetical protein